MAKTTKNKKFLKLVKEYIQIFSRCFKEFFAFAKIMLFAKLKSCSKRFEKIQTYSLSDSKNFSFLIIFSVCLYFLPKKILNVFVKNISLLIFLVANSISYTAPKTGVSFMPSWPLTG